MKKNQRKEKTVNNKKKENTMNIVFLLDRSGSMAGSESDTIGGYNSFLKEQRNKKIKTKITTVLFDDKYELLHNQKNIDDVKELTEKEYYVRGCTALLDAVGITINNIEKTTNKEKVLFVITTDGLENASREYTKEKVKELIKSHSDWEFLYIGANIDSYSEGSALGISKNNISNYKKGKEGTKCLFRSIGKASEMMISEEKLDNSWKEELENNFNNF